MAQEIFGNHPLIVTPMLRDGSIDENGLRQLVDFVIDGGAHGILPLGTTGEFFSLNNEERQQVIRITVEQARDRIAVGVGAADISSRMSAEMAAYAESVGVDYVLIPPPFYAPLAVNTSDGIYRFFREVADATEIMIMLYDWGSGIEVPLDIMRRLYQETTNVRMVKLNTFAPDKVAPIKEIGMRAFCGTDLTTLLMMGYEVDGITIAGASVMPRECTDLYEKWKAGDKESAREIHYNKLLPVINVALAALPQYIACFKMILYRKGLIASPTVRPPLVPLDEVRATEIEAVAERVGLI
jgi:4-hydroxy-tetrahydrodipicolinate synthase